jgi:hypothetical protein
MYSAPLPAIVSSGSSTEGLSSEELELELEFLSRWFFFLRTSRVFLRCFFEVRFLG